MRNIFKDIHFDEEGDAELTQLIANDLFIAPTHSPGEAQYSCRKPSGDPCEVRQADKDEE